MVADCSNVAANTTGATLCELMNGVGNGLGTFFAAIQDSLVEIILVLGVVGAVIALIYAVSGGLGTLLRGAFSGRSR